jgi:hypothetical protein
MNRARSFALIGALVAAIPLAAQTSNSSKSGESYFGTTFSVEGKDISDGCNTKQTVLDKNGQPTTESKPLKELVPGCLTPIFHGNKGLYPSFTNLPPGNGLALGAVFKDSELNTPRLPSWRFDYQVGAQRSLNGSWTAGGFLTMKLAPTKESQATPTTSQPTEGTAPSATPATPVNPNKPTRWLHPPIVSQGPIPKRLPNLGENETKLLLNFYAFHTSLNQVTFFGIGPDTLLADRSFFGLRETVTGANADVLLPWGLHFLGELNGRWPTIGPDHGQSSPSIEQVYTEATAPGLTRQPGFLQPGEGLQFLHHGGGLGENASFGAAYDLDWTANFQQFFAPSISTYSFRRLTIDATNEIHFKTRFKPKKSGSTSEESKDVSSTSQAQGTLQLRGWMSESVVSAGHVVPFYFQPTLGGGDIDKERTLASYADYRFRAPNALLFRAQFEQPLPKYSFLGLVFRADSGKVGVNRGDLDLSHLRHSYGAGFTIRADNFPYLIFMYAWGGAEGHHTFADLNLSAISAGGGTASLW